MKSPHQNLHSQFGKKVDQEIHKSGFDKNYINAVQHHMETLHEFLSNEDESCLKKRIQYSNLLLSKLFFDRLEIYPTRKFTCQIDEKSNWPTPVIPTEVFGGPKLDENSRRKCFYKGLNVSDILDCRVTEIFPQEYHLRVIHKYGVTRMVDDLNIKVVMPRNEISILKREMLPYELIRVAVKEIKKEDPIVISVTVDEDPSAFVKARPKLGFIPDDSELPIYVREHPDYEKNSSYSDYLNGMIMFGNSSSLPVIYTGFGIDIYEMHSYFPHLNGKKCSDSSSAQRLLTESKRYDAKKYLNFAIDDLNKNKNIDGAYSWIEKAIKICPKEDPLLSTGYEIRAKIHEKAAVSKKFNKNVVLDLERALAVDSNNDDAKKHQASMMWRGANCYYKKRMYTEAAAALECVLKLDPAHAKGLKLWDRIHTKHKDLFLNLDEISLPQLQEVKKKILKKIHA